MSTSAAREGSSAPDSRSVQDIERDLASKRQEFGATLEALGAKLDVKSRAKDWARDTAEEAQHRAHEIAGQAKRGAKELIDTRGRELAIAGGAVGAALVALVISRARKR